MFEIGDKIVATKNDMSDIIQEGDVFEVTDVYDGEYIRARRLNDSKGITCVIDFKYECAEEYFRKMHDLTDDHCGRQTHVDNADIKKLKRKIDELDNRMVYLYGALDATKHAVDDAYVLLDKATEVLQEIYEECMDAKSEVKAG